MKLFITPTSPYSRRARIAVIEAGYGDKCEEINVGPLADNVGQVLAHSPGGKVPTLVLDDGTTISECMIIAHYMDQLCGGKLYPTNPEEALACYRLESLGALLMDSMFVRSGQNRLPDDEKSKTVINKEVARSGRLYDSLEACAGDLDGQTHMGALSVAAALSYADWRGAADNWRASHPKLDAWMKSMDSHPSIAATARPDGM